MYKQKDNMLQGNFSDLIKQQNLTNHVKKYSKLLKLCQIVWHSTSLSIWKVLTTRRGVDASVGIVGVPLLMDQDQGQPLVGVPVWCWILDW